MTIFARFPAVAALAAILLLLPLAAAVASGERLAPPAGKAVLTLSGNVKQKNAGGKAVFDRAMIDRLATETIETSTPWTQGKHRFEGFALDRLLKAAGAEGTTLKATALDDYAVEMPLGDTLAAGAFVAVRQNGKPELEDQRGPLWIIFPYDSDPRLIGKSYMDRSVWQLKTLEIR